MSLPSDSPDLAALSSLDDPVRRRLYEVVTQRAGPVGRDEAAAAAGIGRALAVYHLDKLVESGLLVATYSRPAGRSGPGAGRPAKLYARSGREFAVTVPPREDELAARLRGSEIPIIARVEEGRVLLDLRTVFPEQDAAVATALGRIVS